MRRANFSARGRPLRAGRLLRLSPALVTVVTRLHQGCFWELSYINYYTLVVPPPAL